jgi:hypothetical protein
VNSYRAKNKIFHIHPNPIFKTAKAKLNVQINQISTRILVQRQHKHCRGLEWNNDNSLEEVTCSKGEKPQYKSLNDYESDTNYLYPVELCQFLKHIPPFPGFQILPNQVLLAKKNAC